MRLDHAGRFLWAFHGTSVSSSLRYMAWMGDVENTVLYGSTTLPVSHPVHVQELAFVSPGVIGTTTVTLHRNRVTSPLESHVVTGTVAGAWSKVVVASTFFIGDEITVGVDHSGSSIDVSGYISGVYLQ